MIEYLFRGWSHQSMFLLGGTVFIFIGLQNELDLQNQSLIKQALKGWAFTLISEFITGCIVNLWLGWNIWDYSSLPGNILGQTTWQFALLFLPLCFLGIFIDDWVRHVMFGEQLPSYRL